MAKIERYYDSNRGLDLKSSDLTRKRQFASSMMNAQYRKSGAPEKRRGWQAHSGEILSFGTFKFPWVNADDVLEEIVVSAGRDLKRLEYTTITVEYVGSEASAYLSFYFDTVTEQYRCKLTAGLSDVLDFACGEGVDDNSPVTIADLATAIDAVPDFNVAVVGTDTVAAAFLKIVRDINVKDTPWVGKAGRWVTVNQTVTNPFDGSYNAVNEEDFENVSAAVLNNVLYLSNGYDYLYKYDGQNLYRAGLPKPASIASAEGGAGAVTGSNYVHRAQYVQYDNSGNIIEANILSVGTALNPAAKQLDITVANILAGTGFNTNAAIVAGAQVAVNQITVDNGSGGNHTMQVGDTAYFFDAISAGYVEREVTAKNNTSITVAGAAVTVADNAVISNNLRISIQRNKTSAITPSQFYLVAEIPNNPFTATQVYVDNLTDAQLGELIIPPATDRSLPPKGRYICAFQKLLFSVGDPADQTMLSWSDIDGAEYFPADSNKERVENSAGEIPRAIGACGTVLAILTPNTTQRGSGTFGDNNYRIEEVSGSIGCSAHSSLCQAEGFLTWWSDNGPYKMAPGSVPSALGPAFDDQGRELPESRIAPVMDQDGYGSNPMFEESFFRSRRVVGILWSRERKLLYFLPAETVQASTRTPNANSRVYAYDYPRDAWLEWSNLNFAGGACLFEDELYFVSRRFADGDVVSELQRFHNLNDAWDYQDNLEPIDWSYGPQWEALNEPGVLKKFLELQVYSLEEIPNNAFTLSVKQEINYQTGGTVAEFDIALVGSGYGQSAYGTDPYGDPANPRQKHELHRDRTYSTRTIFTNDEPQTNCIVTGWEIACETPYRREFKK